MPKPTDEGLELSREKRGRARLNYHNSRPDDDNSTRPQASKIHAEGVPIPPKQWPKGKYDFVEQPKQPMIAPMAPKGTPKFIKRELMFPYTFDGPLEKHAEHLIQDCTWIASDYRNTFWAGMLYECAVVMKELYNAWQGEVLLNEKRLENQKTSRDRNSAEISERRAGLVRRKP